MNGDIVNVGGVTYVTDDGRWFVQHEKGGRWQLRPAEAALVNEIERLRAENERLRGEVERMGAMVDYYDDPSTDDAGQHLINAVFAARTEEADRG